MEASVERTRLQVTDLHTGFCRDSRAVDSAGMCICDFYMTAGPRTRQEDSDAHTAYCAHARADGKADRCICD